ncbi:MAG TPA: YdcH family protein [Candidatus Angelobacter sp.]|nr:YdcH family protein [Candidatus Angelobacter sp.]
MVDSVREQLLASHDQFRELAQQHSQYSARLNSLCEKRFLTEEEQMEEVRLKKLKLRIKDQMHTIEREYRGGQVQVA